MGSSVGFLSAIFGGVLVSLITYLTNKSKVQAEAELARADAEKKHAEASRINAESGLHNTPQRQPDSLPAGWIVGGTAPEDYDFGVDTGVFHSGQASGFIKSHSTPKGFATLMQNFRAESHRGARLMVSAMIRTREVLGWTGLWMRIDSEGDGALAFDNMYDRRITGTTGWKWYSVVLDVPQQSENIAFGVLLVGVGRVWIDSVTFDIVGSEVEVTETKQRVPLQPVNLDFSEGVD